MNVFLIRGFRDSVPVCRFVHLLLGYAKISSKKNRAGSTAHSESSIY